jgi:hypothetical protein
MNLFGIHALQPVQNLNKTSDYLLGLAVEGVALFAEGLVAASGEALFLFVVPDLGLQG